jgi:hypothetical protein
LEIRSLDFGGRLYLAANLAKAHTTVVLLRLAKVIWLLSVLAALATLLYVYAAWPEEIAVFEGERPLLLSRDIVFYAFLGGMAVLNSMVYMVSALNRPEAGLPVRTWYHVFTSTLNLFLIIALQYLNLFNSGEKFAYDTIGPIIYGSIVLVVLTALFWPLFRIWKAVAGKHKPA